MPSYIDVTDRESVCVKQLLIDWKRLLMFVQDK